MKQFDIRSRIIAGVLTAALAFTGCATQPAGQPVEAPAAAGDVVPSAADAERLIALQGALNVRTFGNLRGSRGPIPAASFVRAADLYRLTPADRDRLAAAGVKLDLDLRTAEEEGGAHDVLADDGRFQYRRISLMGSERLDLSSLPDSLGVLYVQALDANQPQFRQVFEAIAAQKDGTVLFHCTAGKDRTGMISAMLLSLAGVARKDIVHNYAISAHYLGPSLSSNPQMAAMLKANPKIAALAGTPPEAIEAFLDSLDRKYGGARAYLGTIGVSDADVQSLLMRLGQAR